MVENIDVTRNENLVNALEVVPNEYSLSVLQPAQAYTQPAPVVYEVEVLDTTQAPRDYLEAFTHFLRLDVSEGMPSEDTKASYAREVRFWLLWCKANFVDPERAERIDVQNYREHLRANDIAVATRNLKLTVVRRFYEALIKYGFARINPAAGIVGGKELSAPEDKIKSLSRDALDALVQSIPTKTFIDKRDRVVIALMAIHGLRRVEIHRLDHKDIEIGNAAAGDNSVRLRVVGKGQRVRLVYLRPDVWAALCVYIEAKNKKKMPLEGALFLADNNRTRGERLARRSVNMITDKYLNLNDLKRDGVSCHSLRHTHATLAIASGAKVEHVRDNMGHSSIAVTDTYVRAVGRAHNNPANFIDVEINAVEEVIEVE